MRPGAVYGLDIPPFLSALRAFYALLLQKTDLSMILSVGVALRDRKPFVFQR
jgi:hypothetical protein